MVKNRPTLKLNLSGEALLKLQAKLPKPYVKPSPKDVFKDKKEGKKKKENPAPTSAKRKKLDSKLDINQFFGILTSLQVRRPRCFPPKDKPALPLAIGLHKDIAKEFDILVKKAFYFCRMYCGSKRYKAAVKKRGVPRYNLKGKKVGKVE